jgi:hypothetical protein
VNASNRYQRSGAGPSFASLLLPLFGVLLGLAIAEVALRFAELRPLRLKPAEGPWKMHYADTHGGMGKCYPSNPHGYFPYDLRTEAGMRDLGANIGDVTGMPDDTDLEARIEHLRRHAPFCTNNVLSRLNGGPAPDRSRQALIIGDSFAFGEGLRLEDTIGYRLAEYFPDINFRNMSWPGNSIDTLYDVRGTGPEIDTVLYFYNINDLLRTDELQLRRLRLHDTSRDARLQADIPDGAPLLSFCHYFRLCHLVRLRQTEIERSQATIDYYHEIYFGPENEEPRRRSFALIGTMAEGLAAREVRFVVLLFPLYYRPPLTDYPFRRIHAKVAEEMERLGIEVVDLLPGYDRHLLWDKFTVHPLDRHPSAKAIEVAARHVRDHLDLDLHVAARQ